MEVLFLILKIIGICLLVLLGLCLFLVLSVVFIPVRYRIRGKGETPKSIEADAVFSWFLHIIHCRIHYDEKGFFLKFRIFGIPISLGKKEEKKKKPKEQKTQKKQSQNQKRGSKEEKFSEIRDSSMTIESKKQRETEESGEKVNAEETESILETTESEETANIEDITELVETVDSEEIIKESNKDKQKQNSKMEKKPDLTDDSRGFLSSFRQKLDKIKNIFKNLKKKFLQLKEQLGNIKSILSEETNRNALAAIFREMKYLMRHYSPRKAVGELQFGMEDPADTGQVLGIISLLPFWYRYKISVTPDFTAEESYAKGELSMKGHIRSIHLFLSGIRLIKNKDIRKLINQIRK